MPVFFSAKFSRLIAWVVLVVCLGFVFWHTASVDRYLRRVSDIDLRMVPPAEGNAALKDVTLAVAADGQTWSRLTQERVARGEWRSRHTETDNAPEGREVHWSSWWSLWLEACARWRGLFTGEDLDGALAKVARWVNLPLWTVVLVGGAAWVGRRWGPWSVAVFAAAILGNRGFYTALYPAYPDHHGPVAVLALGMILGAVGAALEWRGGEGHGDGGNAKAARRAAIFSAICGAWGLALSASSLVFPIALVGVGGVIAVWAAKGDLSKEEARAISALWRLWGRVGAGAALLFYMLEYAPGDFSWRLEVNHPVYALAWWGGAELAAWATCVRWGAVCSRAHGLAILGAIGVSAPLVVLAWGGATIFAPMDEFMSGVHGHIDEFQSIRTLTWYQQALFFAPVLLPLIWSTWLWRRLTSRDRGVLAGLSVVVLGLGLLAVMQQRWWGVAAAAQIPFAVLVTMFVGRAGVLPGIRWACAVAVVAMVVPGPWILARERLMVEKKADVQRGEAMQLLYRDVAATLRMASPDRDIVLLASPNASVAMGYYGDLRSIGTLYWENGDGLRAAAEALTATEDDEAERIIRTRRITHLALVSPGDFTAEYADALGLPPDVVAKTLGRRALAGRDLPVWLRAIPYRVPPQFDRIQAKVSLYAVDWNIARADSRWALGMSRLIAGDEVNGRAALRDAAGAGLSQAGLILAWRMATSANKEWRDGPGAVEWAEAAIAKLPESAANRRVLAAAYAAAGRWADAQATALFAIDQAQEAGDLRLRDELEVEFSFYRERRALSE